MKSLGMFSPAQLRAARGLLDWTREKLAADAEVDIAALQAFEAAATPLEVGAARRLRDVLDAAGVRTAAPTPLHGEGVRLTLGALDRSAPDRTRFEASRSISPAQLRAGCALAARDVTELAAGIVPGAEAWARGDGWLSSQSVADLLLLLNLAGIEPTGLSADREGVRFREPSL